jgi:hypothetical protein
VQIPLTQHRSALVDPEDHAAFGRFRWCYRAGRHGSAGYAVRHAYAGGKARLSYLHRAVMDEPAGLCVIFRNGDGLDCRKRNLKAVSRQEACWHRRVRRDSVTGLKGVSRDAVNGRWYASITRRGRYRHIGTFGTADAALEAYRRAEEEFASGPCGCEGMTQRPQGDDHEGP